MMDKDTMFGTRGSDLEEAFFAQQNRQLLAELKKQAEHRERRTALAKATGIGLESILDKLIELDVNVERAAAFTLIPLVEVAWADGEVHDRERQAILQAAAAKGLEPGSIPYQLLEGWLSTKPEARLLEVWKEYTRALVSTFDAGQRTALQHDLLDRARAVAEAAGGFLGLGKISAAEEAMLTDLEKAFG
jgi:tellurite resistance protein